MIASPSLNRAIGASTKGESTLFAIRSSARKCLVAVSLLGAMSIATVPGREFEIVENSTKTAVTLNSSAQDQYNAAELFSRLKEHNGWQKAHIDRFSVVRTYTVEDDKGKTHAEEVVVMEYKTPGTKTFRTTSASGSAFIRGHVFKQLMKREAGRATGRHGRDSSITPNNYAFETLGKERIGSAYCFVVHAVPKRKETYLFDGKIWIDDQDFAIVKVTGHLVKSPSFWITSVDFVRQYQKIDEFWLPQTERSIAKVRIYGTRILTIDYRNYSLKGVAGLPTFLANVAAVQRGKYLPHTSSSASIASGAPDFAGSPLTRLRDSLCPSEDVSSAGCSE